MPKHDDYMTPRSAWEHIHAYLPKNKVIWEPFFGDGTSGAQLRDLGFQVVHEDEDFFENDSGDYVLIVPKRRIQFTKLEDGKVVPTPGCSY